METSSQIRQTINPWRTLIMLIFPIWAELLLDPIDVHEPKVSRNKNSLRVEHTDNWKIHCFTNEYKHQLTLWHLVTLSEKHFFLEDRRCLWIYMKNCFKPRTAGKSIRLDDLAFSSPCAIWTLQPESCCILLICSPPRPMTSGTKTFKF